MTAGRKNCLHPSYWRFLLMRKTDAGFSLIPVVHSDEYSLPKRH